MMIIVDMLGDDETIVVGETVNEKLPSSKDLDKIPYVEPQLQLVEEIIPIQELGILPTTVTSIS